MVQLPEMPSRIASLPRDERGYPVPWFVAWVDGKPVFPAADPQKLARAVREKRCWVCGDVLGRNFAFVIGPMCSVNRVSAEPPCHLECAMFSAQACPFLTRPKMKRVELDDALGVEQPAGIMIKRNPGVVCVWSTRDYRLIREDRGVLFQIGNPHNVAWLAEGRPALRKEVMASISSGLPILESMAAEQGEPAQSMLHKMLDTALGFLPA